MPKTLAWIFGVVFLVLGVVGFFGSPVFETFEVDELGNVVHLVTGLFAIGAAMKGTDNCCRSFFKCFGIFYAVVAILGFIQADTVLGVLAVDTAGNVLHAVAAVVALAVGFKK